MTFGTPTKGLTSSLELMEFNSHAKLFLATMYLCSRDKKMIDRGLNHDVACSAERAYELEIKRLKKPGDSAYFAAGKSSEASRVGKECVSTCRSRCSLYH